MSYATSRYPAAHPTGALDSQLTASSTTEITIYGCGSDEAALFRELAPRFGVLPTMTEEVTTEDTVDLASGMTCISVGHKTRVTNSTLLALSRLGVRYVSTRSVGCNHIDVDYAASVGITIGNVAYSPDSVADYTLMLMLMGLRQMRAVIRRADAHDYRLSNTRGRELRDLTVGVVGTGHIGTAVIDRLRGFGCRVLAHDINPTGPAEYVPLETLLRHSDIVTLHTPLTEQTRHLLDTGCIAHMKPGAYVVNTGRGALIDTEALLCALVSGHLHGAALDVLEGEEGIFYADHRETPIASELLLGLHALPNVLITPHTAYYTDHALRDTVENTLVNCVNYEGGNQHG
ncbi:MAG: D-isomer specific 2-hydroxyacid dehydrogenase NAD-binding protein [Nocardioides sp.]|nr:D-isomer specific 2-hydroxyacid dehydrogenase NAD-binding protein [Nocardioides sp.]